MKKPENDKFQHVETLSRNVSVNQLITLAGAEKLSVLMTADYIEKRGAKASRDRFLQILGKAKDQEPAPSDGCP